MITAEQILTEARSWLGTPYRYQASTRNEGADCLGLVRGVWRGLYGEEPEAVPPYTPGWAEAGTGETLLDAAERWLLPTAREDPQPGDVLVFRFAAGCAAKHCAIYVGEGRMIHAWQGRSVCETTLGRWWQRRLAGTFRFPPSA